MPLSPPARRALGRLSRMPRRFLPSRRKTKSGAAVSVARRRGPSDPPALRPAAEGTGAGRQARSGAAVAARAAPCLRQPSARSRRRSAQRAADARPRRHRDDANLYPCPGRAAAATGRDRASAGAAKVKRSAMRHFLDFERPIAELEGKIEELRHLSTESGLNIADEVGRLEAQADRLLQANLRPADAVAEGAGGAPSRAAALPRLHRRPDRRLHAARRRPRVRRGCGGDRRHRPVSRAQRRRARHREGRRYRGRIKHNFGMARPGGLSQGAPADAPRRAVRASGADLCRHRRRLSRDRRRGARPEPRRSPARSRPASTSGCRWSRRSSARAARAAPSRSPPATPS